MNSAADPLPAIAESDATGDTAILFDDIRQTLAVPVVNLIFRRLATFPQALPWCWQTLKPLYVDGTIDRQADALRESLVFPVGQAISHESLANADLSRDDLQTIRMILRSYERSNAMNLVAFSALLAKLKVKPVGVQGDMPKPLALSEMNKQTRSLALHLASIGGEDPIMPTMYRHLAHWPSYLLLISDLLTPMQEQQMLGAAIKAVVSDGHQRATRITGGLGQSDVKLDATVRAEVTQTIEAFLEGVIAKMIVVVGVIKKGMPRDD